MSNIENISNGNRRNSPLELPISSAKMPPDIEK
jgi:hypothetical protein